VRKWRLADIVFAAALAALSLIIELDPASVHHPFDNALGADDMNAPGRLIEWVWKPSWSIAIPRLIVGEVCAKVSANLPESGGGGNQVEKSANRAFNFAGAGRIRQQCLCLTASYIDLVAGTRS
jgi:hypothetical protein